MAKTVGDYVMEGGIKGRKFVDPVYNKHHQTIYEVISIKSVDKGGSKPLISFIGKVVETNEVYIQNLALCLEHEEYIPFSHVLSNI